MKKLYVGNIPWATTEEDLTELFGSHGVVASAKIILDRQTGRSRGFGFVEMENDEEANNAIQALHGNKLGERDLTVNEAREKAPRDRGGY